MPEETRSYCSSFATNHRVTVGFPALVPACRGMAVPGRNGGAPIIRAMKRRLPVVALLATLGALPVLRAQGGKPASSSPRTPFTVVEASIPEMRRALEQGRTTSHQIVEQYLTRIATYE